MKKICKVCGSAKAQSEFNKHPTTKDRLQQSCRPCHRAQSRKYAEKYVQARAERTRKWSEDHPGYATRQSKAWRDNNRDHYRELSRARYANNPSIFREAGKRWAQKNPEKTRQYWQAYDALKRKAMPAWANKKKIAEFYRLAVALERETGIKHHVDHRVPLRGELVCGLHWEGNLQVLPYADNIRKSNKLTEAAYG